MGKDSYEMGKAKVKMVKDHLKYKHDWRAIEEPGAPKQSVYELEDEDEKKSNKTQIKHNPSRVPSTEKENKRVFKNCVVTHCT